MSDAAVANAASAVKDMKVDGNQSTVPEFVAHRIRIFERIQNETPKVEEKPITITLPDGSTRQGVAGVTAPIDVATEISNALAQRVVVAKVNGELHNLGEALVDDCTLELCDFNSKEGRHVFWHSGAHILGEAMERVLGCNLCVGPALDANNFEAGGFFYEAYTDGLNLGQAELDKIEAEAKKIVKEKQKFSRVMVPKEEALEMFKHNKFKAHMLSKKVPDGTSCSVFRCGDLVDPCRGPHVLHTGRMKHFLITKNSAAYWLGDADNESLQRVYAVAFPDKASYQFYKKLMDEAKERDHRNVLTKQDLGFFHEYSPGSVFLTQHGCRVYQKLQNFIRDVYRRRHYEEVMTPNVFNCKLWETSGHWQHYKDDMFVFQADDSDCALKPMNCPGHCLVFKNRPRSHRELPLRFAEFGVLHRNELSGALSGLTRVRRFVQDDSHIFCTPEQVGDEVHGVLEMLNEVYSKFDFKFHLGLSTRPKKALGDESLWVTAEEQLKAALERFGVPYQVNEGDGAFYGPKIDIMLEDCLKRKHQCATVQLDFNLPIRFDLQYMAATATDADKSVHRPVIIHRAIYGSFERFMAICMEHFAGKWPFWLSPRQCKVITVTKAFNDYAEEVQAKLYEAGFHVDVDLTGRTLNKKVREAQLEQYNYILVVGAEERENGTVNVRTRDNKVHGVRTIAELVGEFREMDADFK